MDFVKQGKDFCRRGLDFDEKKNFEEALKFYLKGIDSFLAASKYIENEEKSLKKAKIHKLIYEFPKNAIKQQDEEMQTKEKIRLNCLENAKQFMERAETIKKMIGGGNKNENKKEETKKEEKKEEKKDDKKKDEKKDEKKDNKKDDDLDKEKKGLREGIEDAILKEKPNVAWSDVAGLKECKKALEEALILPRHYPQLFVGKRKPWRSVLLYGPPGTGKSFLAKAVATRIGGEMTFFSISSSNLVSKWLGESEKLVRTLFEMAIQDAPSVVFIDEVDSICSSRESGDSSESTNRIKTEFLVQMQKVLDMNDPSKYVVMIAATNRPFDLDPAVRRRFEKRIMVPLPDEEARAVVIKVHAGKEFDISDQDIKELAKNTDGFSCADISIAVRDALLKPVREAMKCKFFKKIKNETTGKLEKIVPCEKGEKGSEEMSIFDISSEESSLLSLAKPNKKDLIKSFESTPKSVGKDEISENDKFTTVFGNEG